MEALWTRCAEKKILRLFSAETGELHFVGASSTVLSLEPIDGLATMRDVTAQFFPGAIIVKQRFEEQINGRAYLIEVSCVGMNQWRAQIARAAGGSAALMPFYGKTPDEAAQHLCRWLAMLHKTPGVASPPPADPRRI